MHRVGALIEIKIEDDVPVGLKVWRRKRDVSDRHGEFAGARTVSRRIARDGADRNCPRVIGRRYWNKLSESRQVGC